MPLAVHLLRSKECREEFQHTMSQSLKQNLYEDGRSLEGRWEKQKTAEESLDRERKKQPDWFAEVTDELMPQISAK